MDTTTAAQKLNVDSKKLRRVIRRNPHLASRVDGGSYSISTDQLRELQSLVQPSESLEHQGLEVKYLDQDRPMKVSEVARIWQDRAARARAKSQYRDRQSRLIKRIDEVL